MIEEISEEEEMETSTRKKSQYLLLGMCSRRTPSSSINKKANSAQITNLHTLTITISEQP